jgi:acyl carrier protein
MSQPAARVQTGQGEVGTVGEGSGQTPFEAEIAALMVERLQLDVEAAEIEPEARLFHEGLGLDSIDALELALALSRRYGLELRSDDERNGEIFRSLRSLAGHVAAHRRL